MHSVAYIRGNLSASLLSLEFKNIPLIIASSAQIHHYERVYLHIAAILIKGKQ
jgi:hypothetical protein